MYDVLEEVGDEKRVLIITQESSNYWKIEKASGSEHKRYKMVHTFQLCDFFEQVGCSHIE